MSDSGHTIGSGAASASSMQPPAPVAASSASAAAAAVPPTQPSFSRGWSLLRQTRASTKAELLDDSHSPLFYSVMVHNLSHSDLMLGLRIPTEATNQINGSTTATLSPFPPSQSNNSTPANSTGAPSAAASSASSAPTASPTSSGAGGALPASIIARPKFNRFKQISGRLLTYVENSGMQMQGVEFPSPLAGRFNHSSSNTGGNNNQSSQSSDSKPATCPYGFRVKDGQMKFQDWDAFKLKGDQENGLAKYAPKPEIVAAYFPMLAVLIPRWLSIVAGKNARRGIRHSEQNKKLLFLISGAGTPWNTDHDASGNSTKGVAKLATWFLNQFYPEVEVHTIHSGVEIFHYDANVSFVNKELKPRIEEVRRFLAEKYLDKWPKYMHLALTLTDGASARISAINASLRIFKPDCLHMWQLKSFWHEYPMVTGSRGEADVEFHEFEKLEMTPPTLVSETDNWTKMLVKEMIAHKEEFERVRDNKERVNELDNFWLRKSKQPVLSVLMVKKKNKAHRFFRGINVEVSMPTGSLCSERNAIGSALSSDPSLCRKDLRMIAVLALGLDPHSTTSTISANHPITPAMLPIGSLPPAALIESKNKNNNAMEDVEDSNGPHVHFDEPLPPKNTLIRTASANRSNSTSLQVPTSPSIKSSHSPSSSSRPSSSVPIASEEATESSTPRKRKAAGGASSAAAANVNSPSTGALTPQQLMSPRLTRSGSQQSQAANNLPILEKAALPMSTGVPASPRTLARDFSESAQPNGLCLNSFHAVATAALALNKKAGDFESVTPPGGASSVSPPVVVMQTRSSNNNTPVQEENPRKRLKKTNSLSSGGGMTLTLPEVSPNNEATSPSSSPLGISLPEGLDKEQVHYVKHELDMVRHRDAMHLSPHSIAKLSGNNAVNAPMDRCASEEVAKHPLVGAPTDERNPINPCGACNEWLKKIAEVNPDFKVITFTSTDCSTCFIKSVKF